jgi:hypothetical protein
LRYSLVVVLLISLPCWTQTLTTGQATTNTPCSVANSGNGNKIQINCGIGKEQGQKIIAILNKIVANQLDPDVVMAKLDEILKAVNPNLPTKVYFCDGHWRTAGPGPNVALQLNLGGDDSAFQGMVQLNNSGRYADLLNACLAQIQSAPEWLTPRLFCGLAYLGAGDKSKAKEMLTEFDSKTGPAYNIDGCQQMSDHLHKALQ